MGFLRICCVIFLGGLPFLSFAQEEGMEYERSSLHLMMIKHLNQKFDDIIEQVFAEVPFPNRFNNHDLGVKVVSFAEMKMDQQANIESFLKQVNYAQKVVSKWFNRDKVTGSFNMELVKNRGFYNASHSQRSVARASLRGKAMLEDAGEELIGKSYLIVNDILYTSKAGTSSFLKSIVAGYLGSTDNLQRFLTEIGGFRVEVISYLFRLKWNDEIAHAFYEKYYTENGDYHKDKVRGYEQEKELFQMEFVGKTSSQYSETKFSGVDNPRQLLVKVCTRAIDKNIAQLQHHFADFRIKAPLVDVEPLKAYVGMKEDVSVDSRFEVLERVIGEDGTLEYHRVGVVKPQAGKIWDNRFMAEEEKGVEATTFDKVSGGDFYAGMLIREIE